ncbi:MAG TPA: hypothetical protein VNU01_02330 [Egibacteraceae bacterium]|nr:hypothetical protein [Egibacteraceae bacterium]
MSDVERPAVSRNLLIGLGAIALLAVLWLLVLGPMLAGDEEGGDDVVVVPPREARSPDAPLPGEDAPDADGGLLYPETTEVFAARDPFAQLVRTGPDGGGGDDDDGGTGAGTDGGTGTGDGTSGGTGDGTSGGTGDGTSPERPSNGSSARVGGTTVKLVDVYTEDDQERALVTVNGRSYDVAEGESFGDRFRLLDLSGECGTFLFGDSRFVLCEGDEIRK